MSEERITVYTIGAIAKELELNRSTLVRMEQRGVIPEAKWVGAPINGRAYTEDERKKVIEKVGEYFAAKAKKAGRDFITHEGAYLVKGKSR